jgi:predicted nucleotidyltransferase
MSQSNQQSLNISSMQCPNVQSILGQIVGICSADANVMKVTLFGSRAKGNAMERSDIDIALIGDDIDMEKLRDEVFQIDTLLKIDLVDFNNCKNDLLKSEVLKDGITLFSKI